MSRHAAPPSRRSRSSELAESDSASTVVSVAELVARHRATTGRPVLTNTVKSIHPTPLPDPSPISHESASGPVTAADLIARYAGTSDLDNLRADRRRHAAAPTPRSERSVFLRPVPIKVVARPALIVAAVVATVATVDASSSVTSTASSASGHAGVAGHTAGSGPVAPAVAAPVTSVSPSVMSRISRDQRSNNAPLIHFRPGQTVPGVWVKPNVGPETSCFCMRWGAMHEGIDLAGPLGSPILAAGDGVVVKAGPQSGFGNVVTIRHANGDVTLYGHMRYFFVQAGQHVVAGQKIALVGNEGDSTGPHLHFEVHPGGDMTKWIDPAPWLTARGVSIGPYDPNG